MTTDPATLPQYDGRPVPWVTRWTSEIVRQAYTLVPGRHEGRVVPRITYGDDREIRDQLGTLWQREGISRGGRPDWASVSTYRQRLSMLKRRCQVCGQKINERPIRWLMPPDGIEIQPTGEALTIQPPTCSDCIDLSLGLCPNLKRHGYQIVKVLDYEPWGVYGEFLQQQDGQMVRGVGTVGYESVNENFTMQQVLAKQLVVRLDKFVIETTVQGNARVTHPPKEVS